MTHVHIAAFFLLMVAGCATTQEVRRLNGTTEFSISCWYFDWNMCYAKANELCRGRQKFLSQHEGINGKELRIACHDGREYDESADKH
jgi:hypothetical protein